MNTLTFSLSFLSSTSHFRVTRRFTFKRTNCDVRNSLTLSHFEWKVKFKKLKIATQIATKLLLSVYRLSLECRLYFDLAQLFYLLLWTPKRSYINVSYCDLFPFYNQEICATSEASEPHNPQECKIFDVTQSLLISSSLHLKFLNDRTFANAHGRIDQRIVTEVRSLVVFVNEQPI